MTGVQTCALPISSGDVKSVQVGAIECIIASWSSTEIVCTLAAKQLAGVSNVLVYVPGQVRFPPSTDTK